MSFPRTDLYRLTLPLTQNNLESVIRVWLKPANFVTTPGLLLSDYSIQNRNGVVFDVDTYANDFIDAVAPFYNPADAVFGVAFLEAFEANTADAIYLAASLVSPQPTGASPNTPGSTRTYTQRTLDGRYAVLRLTQAPIGQPFRRPYQENTGQADEQNLATFQNSGIGTCQCNLDGSNIYSTLNATGRWNSQLQDRIFNI